MTRTEQSLPNIPNKHPCWFLSKQSGSMRQVLCVKDTKDYIIRFSHDHGSKKASDHLPLIVGQGI